MKVLLLERWRNARGREGRLAEPGRGVVSARFTGRALDFCNTQHLRFDVLVLGPSLLEPGLGGFLGRVLQNPPVVYSTSIPEAGSSAIGGADSDRLRASGLQTPMWNLPRIARRAETGMNSRCARERFARVGPGSGLALEGPGFYVWDEEPDRAREWARELTLVQSAELAPSSPTPGPSPPKRV